MFFVDGRSKSGAGLPTFAIVVAAVVSVAVPVAVAMYSIYLLVSNDFFATNYTNNTNVG
jgi:hypothetical protein